MGVNHEQIRPGMFGKEVAADARRTEFDILNDQLLYKETEIDVLFMGDSITHFWDLYAYFGRKMVIGNRGIGGDTSEYLLKRFDADCIQLKPRRVVIMIGTNDIFRVEPDLWWRKPGEPMETVLADYENNIRQMVEKCDDAGIEVILCSVLPSKIAPPFHRELWWEVTRKMNAFLKSLGKTYVDYYEALAKEDGSVSDELTWDGIHPNGKGYQIMSDILKKTLDIFE